MLYNKVWGSTKQESVFNILHKSQMYSKSYKHLYLTCTMRAEWFIKTGRQETSMRWYWQFKVTYWKMICHQFFPCQGKTTVQHLNEGPMKSQQKDEHSKIPETSSNHCWIGHWHLQKCDWDIASHPFSPCMQLSVRMTAEMGTRYISRSKSIGDQKPIPDIKTTPNYLSSRPSPTWCWSQKLSCLHSGQPVQPPGGKPCNIL